MDYRHNLNPRMTAKKVWYIDGHGFESDKGTKNGAEKAKNYCLEHMLNTNDIIVFDSETEYFRFRFLKAMEAKERISNISVHQLFPLIGAFDSACGRHHEALEYEADFVYTDSETGRQVVEDVKGSKYTIEEVFYVKWKVFDLRYKAKGLGIQVVMCRDRKHPENPDAWYTIDDVSAVKATKGVLARKNAAKVKELKAKQKEAEKASRKLERLKGRYLYLKSLPEPTKAQRMRLASLEQELRENGVILG